jgi:dihydroorotate dehydrogenase
MIPVWKFLPAQLAHDLAPLGAHLWADLWPARDSHWREFQWKGLIFSNRLGLAGGADKNADLLNVWPRLGFGFVEIGTVTPLPQEPNSGKIMDRQWSQKLLWNRMGFPSAGIKEVSAKISTSAPIGVPLFLNVGKNRTTPNERAFEDYQIATQRLAPLADAIVVNISSPNTTGLRDLQDKKSLRHLIESVVQVCFGKPILVKFSPDEEESSLRDSLASN